MPPYSLPHYVLCGFVFLTAFNAVKSAYSDLKLFKFATIIYDGIIPWRVFAITAFNIGIVIDVFYAISNELSDDRLFVILTLNTIIGCSLSYAAICVLRDMEDFAKKHKKER